MKIFQKCSNATGWTVVEVDSDSDPSVVYKVVLSEWDYLCDCKGFEFNGHCKHKAKAETMRCMWEEGSMPCQSEIERKGRICPVCGSRTQVVAEGDDGEWD